MLAISPINGLSCVCHETATTERGSFQEIRQRTAVVEVEMADQQQVYFRGNNKVKKRQGCVTSHAGMYTAVQHYLLSLVLQHYARPADFLPGAKWFDHQLVTFLRWNICRLPLHRC